MRVRWCPTFKLAVLLAICAWGVPVAKAQAAIQLDLPSQPLADSLRLVASQTDTNLLFDPPLVAGRQASALSDRLTAEQALNRLLQGTGIGYTRLNERTIILTAAGSGAPASWPNGASGARPESLGDRREAADNADSPVATVQSGQASQGAAPSGAASREIESLEEVVVTAQRRAERLIDVPMSITAITGDELARSGATSLIDIASTVPGFSTAQFSPGQNRVQIRGISSLAGLPTVGEYLDEISVNVQGGAPSYGPDIRFIDMERVEVLRGPQAALYGEGSMGGTIRFLTHNPDLNGVSVGVDTALGTVTDGSQLYRGNVVVNVPLIQDTLGMRFAGGYEKSPGWIDYPATGRTDANSGTSKTARLKTLWKPNNSFTATLLLLDQDTALHADNLSALDRTAPFLLLTPYVDKNRLASLVLEYDVGPFTVLNATGYMNRTSNQTLDFTSLLGGVYAFLGISPSSPQYPKSVAANAPFHFRSFSEELRFTSKGDGPLTWIGGVYYRDYWEIGSDATTATPNPLPFELLNSYSSDESKSTSVYAEGSYRITPA